MIQQAHSAEAHDAAHAEDVILIEHGEEGTTVKIEDPSGSEFAVLVVLVIGVVAVVALKGRRAEHR